MTEETGAAAPAAEQASTPAEGQQAITTTEQAIAPEGEAAQTPAETPEGQEDQPKRRSTSERYRRKISAQAGVIDQLSSQIQELNQKLAASGKSQVELPKPSDYPQGEYDPQYVADLAAIKAEQKISARLNERDEKTAKERVTDQATRDLRTFEERAAKARATIPDFDKIIDEFVEDGGSFAPHVVRRLHSLGDSGPAMAYYLAKNAALADEINSMSPEDAAAEIARLESKVSSAPPKTTRAAPPLKTPSGGATPPVSLHTVAKNDDATEYWKMRKQQKSA